MSIKANQRAANKRHQRDLKRRRVKRTAATHTHAANVRVKRNHPEGADAGVRSLAMAQAMTHTENPGHLGGKLNQAPVEVVNYDALTVKDLRASLKAIGVKGYSKLDKAALLALVKEHSK